MSSEENQNKAPKPRKPGLTSLTLGWMAERLRKAERIKKLVKQGKYKVDSQKIASSIVECE